MSPVVIFSLVVTLLLGAGILAQTVHTLRRLQLIQDHMENEIKGLRSEVVSVGRGAVALGKRLQQMQGRLQTTERRQEDMEYKDVGNIAISHANKLVQMGAAADELVSTCGLSQAEANLVSLMHSKPRSTARSAA